MKIGIGSDHAGYEYKEAIKKFLVAAGHEVVDFGTHSTDPVDYPLFIRPVALAVALGATLAFLLAAPLITRLLGQTGGHVIGRVLGVLLAALAAQIALDGIAQSLQA